MAYKRRLLLWLTVCVGVLVLILIASSFLLPVLFDPNSIKNRVSGDIEQNTGIKIEFRDAAVSMLPYPRVILHKGSIIQPSRVSGEIRSLIVYLRVMPLLTGRIERKKLEIDAPHVSIDITRLTEPHDPQAEKARSLPGLQEVIAVMMNCIKEARLIGNISVDNGTVSLVDEGSEVFRFDQIDGSILVKDSIFEGNLVCGSNLWKTLNVNLRLDLDKLTGKSQFIFAQFHPQLLTGYLFPSAPQQLGESELNLTVGVVSKSNKALEIDFKSSIPCLTIQQEPENLKVRARAAEGQVNISPNAVSVKLSKLDFDFPKLNATAGFLWDPDENNAIIELRGNDVDATALRRVALALLSRYRGVRNTFRVVRGGDVSAITVKAQGTSLADLRKLKSYTIEGDMVNGIIYIPKIQLEVQKASGHAVISQTVLEAKDLKGTTVGNSVATDGRLKLGLKRGKGGSAPFELDINLDADLAYLPPVLDLAVKDQAFLRELALIKKEMERRAL